MKLLFIPRGRYKQDASIFPKNKLSKKKKKKKKKKSKKPISLEATPSRHKPSTFHPTNLNQSLPSESLTRFEIN